MSTFQHAAFIEDAINGVLMQKTQFPFQLVIGEDLSSDTTKSICEKYSREFPSVVRLLPSDRKYGQNENLHRILQACNGKYIALCEGDDYWTDPFKLQKQVDFLDSHPHHVMCFHRVNAVDQDNHPLENNPVTMERHYKGNDFFHIFIPTLAIVYRNCLKFYPAEFFHVKSTDAFIFGMLSGFGKGADLGFLGGNYRKHVGGCYNSLTYLKRVEQSIHTRKLMKRSSFFSAEQRAEITKEISRRTILYSKTFLKKKEPANFLRFILFRFKAA